MPRKLRMVPQFLKEIPMGGGSQGDNASEWNYAESPSGYHGENYERAQNNPDANYLGWWGRNSRGAYYFGDNSRSFEHRAEWAKYDWYRDVAGFINKHIDFYNQQVDVFLKTRDPYRMVDLDKIPTLRTPYEPQHTAGIQKWLKEKADEYNRAVDEFAYEVKQVEIQQNLEFKAKEGVREWKRQEEEQKRQKEIDEANARVRAEKERKQQQEDLKQKRIDALVQTFDKRIGFLEKTVDKMDKQKLDFEQFTVSNMTELDGIRRDLREIDAQSVQKQEKTSQDISRLEQSFSALSNKSNVIDELNKTVQINTKTLSKLDEKYGLLEKKFSKESYDSGIGISRLHDKISKVQKDIRGELTAIQEENKKINKDYIDGMSFFKEKQGLLSKKVSIIHDEHTKLFNKIKGNQKTNDDQFGELRRDLIEVKKEMGTRVKYDVHSNNAAKRRTGTISEPRVRARQYDAARDVLKSYLSTIFAQYTTV